MDDAGGPRGRRVRWDDHGVRPRRRLHQLWEREDLPRRGRTRGEVASGRLRRRDRRRAGRAVGRAGRRRGPAPPGREGHARGPRRALPGTRRRLQGAARDARRRSSAPAPERQAGLSVGQGDRREGASMTIRTPLSDELGIEYPIYAFTVHKEVAAAVSRAGGLGVLGALRFSPEELEEELAWIDEHVDGKPYGVDVVMPASYAGADIGDPEQLVQQLQTMIPDEHRAFVE